MDNQTTKTAHFAGAPALDRRLPICVKSWPFWRQSSVHKTVSTGRMCCVR